MTSRLRPARTRGAVVSLALALQAGCVFSPLGTARTLPVGEERHHVGFGLAVWDRFEHLSPTASYGYRRGAWDGIEAGVGLQLLSPQADLKVALLRTERTALAIDPTLMLLAFQRPVGSLPLMIDQDFGRHFTLVLTSGPLFYGVLEDESAPVSLASSAGLVVRFTDGFALEPTAQWITPLDERFPYADYGAFFFGLGFLFSPDANRVDAD